MMKREINYYECQNIFHLKCWYLWLIWIVVDGLVIYGFVRQIIFHEQWGNTPMTDTGLVISTVILLIISLVFIFMRLETALDKDGCSVKYFPWMCRYRTIPWDSIEKAYVRKYRPVTEYGGWGMKGGGFKMKGFMLKPVRMPFESSKAYTLYGNIGLQLELKNGKRVLVGTQHPQEMEEILKQLRIMNYDLRVSISHNNHS